MAEVKSAFLDIKPGFDLEDFMNLSQETRLDSETLARLTELWKKWAGMARVVQISTGKKSWLAAWLPAEVEIAVDEAWASSPGQGYLQNCLALYICMSIIQELLPQAADGGCAPAPRPDMSLREGLIANGIADEDGTLNKRYAVVTYFPFKGGCEICALSEECPKVSGASSSFASVLLPGHERQGN